MNDLADILEVEPTELHPGFVLGNGNWNSLAIVSTIVLLDEHFGIAIDGEKLRACQTLNELWGLLQEVREA